MENKKEALKSILIVLIALGIIIYYFVTNKSENDVFNYSEGVINENGIQNEITTSLKQETIPEKIKVYVIGEVQRPGVVELEEGARIEEAIILAGGTTQYSDLSKINLAYRLEDGQKISVPSIKDNSNEEVIENEEAVENDNSNNTKININTGEISELTNLPGVGEALAQRIITYRKENGKFKNIEDLKNVSGIGDKKYESLKEYISVK